MKEAEAQQVKAEVQGAGEGGENSGRTKSSIDITTLFLIPFATLLIGWCGWLSVKYMEVDKRVDQGAYQEQVFEGDLQRWDEKHFAELCDLVEGEYKPADRSCQTKSGRALKFQPISFSHLKKPE